jgi:AraC-like DNA-binding protein
VPDTEVLWKARQLEDRRLERSAIRDFVEGARAGDGHRVLRAIEAFETSVLDGWKKGMRAIAKVDDVPNEFRERFLRGPWLVEGDHIRSEVSDDLILLDGLWSLLPRYRGPALILFRGDSIYNRRRRTYLEHIEEHLAEDIAVADLANVACLSIFHFTRAFAATTGVPPHRHVSQRRLETARAMITTGRASLSQIAYECRFSSQSSFTRAFRRATGVTPAEYRRTLR